MKMINARREILDHIGDRDVKYISVILNGIAIEGTLPEVLPRLDEEYDEDYGNVYLQGTIWYTDGTWSERKKYDGSEWWSHVSRPPCPIDDPEIMNATFSDASLTRQSIARLHRVQSQPGSNDLIGYLGTPHE